ncbi:hypothetical protein [Halobacterium litoreum]|uniref:Uncharacterized protein n=1 Tax=Halobacterium litoreum TaxID=2039234 RepID=A0ABD5NEK9_9EURY|nr:hypothetical protein [Halobacterium litoreum]UHH13659.1 hypothetical protein LT972_01370 [Halobacterium litoreum]
MVALATHVVLASALVLVVGFVAGWRAQFDSLPPVRATAAVALGSLVVAYSVASLPGFAAEAGDDPAESAVVAAVAVLLASGLARRLWRRVRS